MLVLYYLLLLLLLLFFPQIGRDGLFNNADLNQEFFNKQIKPPVQAVGIKALKKSKKDGKSTLLEDVVKQAVTVDEFGKKVESFLRLPEKKKTRKRELAKARCTGVITVIDKNQLWSKCPSPEFPVI